MKAVLLAAGLGTRLRPLTDSVPKCLIPVAGKTLLDRWLDALAFAGVDEVLVNTHHLADRVEAQVARRHDSPPRVRLSHEAELLGSAGTLRANADFLRGEDMVLVVNADNLTDFDVRALVQAHRARGMPATMAVFRAPRPTECGIAEVTDGIVVSFEEKPTRPRGDLANAGMYVFHPDVLTLIDERATPLDIGFHLLPQLVGKMCALSIGTASFADIGTPEALDRAQDEWKQRDLA